MSNNFEPAPGEVQGFWSSQAPTDRQCESRSEALNGAQLLLEITKLLSGKELDLDQVQPANLDEVHRREALEAREQIQSRQRKLPSPPPPPIRAEDAGEAFARYCDAAGDEQAKAAGQAFLERLTEDNKPASLLIVTGGGARFDRHGYSTQLLEAYRQLYPERLQSITSPWPFAMWGIDLIGPMPTAPGGAKHAIVAVDYFTKWVEAESLVHITEANTTSFVKKNILYRFGIQIGRAHV